MNVPEDAKEATIALALRQKEKREQDEQGEEGKRRNQRRKESDEYKKKLADYNKDAVKQSEEYQKKLQDFQQIAKTRKKINKIPEVTMEYEGENFKEPPQKSPKKLEDSEPKGSILSISPEKKKRWWEKMFS